MRRRDKILRYGKRLRINKASKKIYYLALTLLLPISLASFGISFNYLGTDPIISILAFILGFISFAIFIVVAIITFVVIYLNGYYGKIIDDLRQEIADMQEGAAITLSAATTQLNDIVEKMADGILIMRPETEFNTVKPSSEPLVTIRQLIMPKKIKKGEK